MAKYAGGGYIAWCLLMSKILMFISIRSAESVLVKATDTNLDYAFVFDESQTMKKGDFHSTMKHLSQWVESIYDTKSDIDTQFAVLGCRQNKSYKTPITMYQPMIVSQYLKDSTNKKKQTIQKINEIRTRNETIGDHRQDCLKKTFNDIFTEAKGDRPDSTNVLFFISDCSYMDNEGETALDKETVNSMRKNKYAFIICITTALDGGVHDKRWNETKSVINQKTWHETALDLVNNDTKRLIIYKNFDQFLKETFELLPQKEVEAIPCKYTKFSTDGCAFNKKTEACENVVMYVILSNPVPMLPVPPGNECPTNFSVQCEKSKCSCSNISMVFGECSVTCGGGVQIGRRNVTLTQKLPNYFESRASDPKCTEETETRTCNPAGCSPTILIVVVICFFVVLLLIIVGVMFSRKKKVIVENTGKSVQDTKSAKQDSAAKMVEEGLSDEAKANKLKGIAADLTMAGKGTMFKAGKSMSITAKGDESKTAKADKSVGAKGGKSVAKESKSKSKSKGAKKLAK